jgi:hypothetical protein
VRLTGSTRTIGRIWRGNASLRLPEGQRLEARLQLRGRKSAALRKERMYRQVGEQSFDGAFDPHQPIGLHRSSHSTNWVNRRNVRSLNHLVGTRDDGRGKLQAERACCFEVEDERDACRLLRTASSPDWHSCRCLGEANRRRVSADRSRPRGRLAGRSFTTARALSRRLQVERCIVLGSGRGPRTFDRARLTPRPARTR